MLKTMLDNVRDKSPLIHNITNSVTANDCANILLAVGASPIMAEDEDEVEEVTSICDGLSMNLGTPGPRKIRAMLRAGRKACELGHPVLLDPVGAGISELRNQAVKDLLSQVSFSVIRGNLSEMRALLSGKGSERGVDAGQEFQEVDSREELAAFAKHLARELHTVVVISGTVDLVADSETAFAVYNGTSMMKKVTGCGCQLSSLMTAFITANQDDVLTAALAAVCFMGVCGETAAQRLKPGEGNATFRNYVIDAVCCMEAEDFEKQARFERL